MGGMVEQQLSDATAMHNRHSELAKRVVEAAIDSPVPHGSAIDEACARIVAKRQPTASDSGLVMVMTSKPSPNWSAFGDVADKICRTALEKFSSSNSAAVGESESLPPHRADATTPDAFARMISTKRCVSTVKTRKLDQSTKVSCVS